ncbi:MAG: adenylate/guanylate cyclase domain-containing protein [Pyrinomonadaceae bacterium]
MPHIHFEPDDVDVEALETELVLGVSLTAGLPHAHACGGKARCSTCRVSITDGLEHCAPRTPPEQALAQRLHFAPEIRLACQTRVSGDVSLRRLVLDADDVELTKRLMTGTASVGEEKLIAILFADIRNFTSFAERLPPYDVIYVLNRYFHRMGKVISRCGGYIDNYMGDGLMAVFGVDDAGDAARRAVEAGLGMLDEVESLRPDFESVYDMSFQIGVGVHYGEAVVGTVGAAGTKRLTAIGDAVNFASRVEAANKEAGTKFLISEDTYYEVKDFITVGRECAEVSLKGKSGAHALYEVVGLKDGRASRSEMASQTDGGDE